MVEILPEDYVLCVPVYIPHRTPTHPSHQPTQYGYPYNHYLHPRFPPPPPSFSPFFTVATYLTQNIRFLTIILPSIHPIFSRKKTPFANLPFDSDPLHPPIVP